MIDAGNEPMPAAISPRRRRPASVTANRDAVSRKMLRVERIWSDAKVKPSDKMDVEQRTAEITDDGGKVIFKQENVEVPKAWSPLATTVVVSKYFYGEQNTAERETSVRQLIHRVCRTIADWGINDGYFSAKDGEVFYEELTWLCLNQSGAFNSPVWFNVGLYHQYRVGKNSGLGNRFYNRQSRAAEPSRTQYDNPQRNPSFLHSVHDNMADFTRLAHRDRSSFKYGSTPATH